MIRRAGHLHAPVEGRARDAEILQARLDEAQHFVAAALGLDELGMLGVELEQRFLIFGETEEPAFLDRPLDRRTLWRELLAILAVYDLLVAIIGFVAHRVPALVAAGVKIAGIRHGLPDRLAGIMVRGLSRADKAVIADAKSIIHFLEVGRHFFGKLGRRYVPRTRRLGHLQAMLVGAGLEENVAAHHPRGACDRVGRDRLIGMADVRPSIGIGNRRGDGEGRAMGLCRGPAWCGSDGSALQERPVFEGFSRASRQEVGTAFS